MTIFSARKDLGPVEPERCTRCRARPGTSWLHFVVSAEREQPQPRARRAWLCDVCRAEVQRGAAGN